MNALFEVAVVGSGPAGAAAAFHLARAGVRVALVDRSEFPRDKVCGDGLTPRAVAQLSEIGCLHGLGLLPAVDSLLAVDPTGPQIQRVPLPRSGTSECSGAVVRRKDLDEAVRQAAVAAGAVFLGQTEATQLSLERNTVTGFDAMGARGPIRISSQVTIVAEGSIGRLTRRLQGHTAPVNHLLAVRRYHRLRAPLEPALRIYAPVFVGGEPICGYGWLFPIDDQWANVGVGLFLPTLRGRRLSPRSVYSSFFEDLARKEPILAEQSACGPLEGGHIRVGLRLDQIAFPGALLVGDAAAVANPFTGEGIAHALESGKAAAEAIEQHLGNGRDLCTEYIERVAASFPHTADWTASLPWMAERASVNAAHFSEMVSGKQGKASRAIRRLILEERPPPAGNLLAEESPEVREAVVAAWGSLEAAVAARHPLLAKVVGESRIELAEMADAVLVAFFKESCPDARRLALPLAFVTLACLIADDVQDDPPGSGCRADDSQGTWALNALRFGACDTLMSECFAVLAPLPHALSSRFASLASQLYAELLCDGLPPSSRPHAPQVLWALRTLATRLARADAEHAPHTYLAPPLDLGCTAQDRFSADP